MKRILLAGAVAAMAWPLIGVASAQDLPKTQFKAIGLNSPTVASTVDEVPFWTKTIPQASKGRSRSTSRRSTRWASTTRPCCAC